DAVVDPAQGTRADALGARPAPGHRGADRARACRRAELDPRPGHVLGRGTALLGRDARRERASLRRAALHAVQVGRHGRLLEALWRAAVSPPAAQQGAAIFGRGTSAGAAMGAPRPTYLVI